MTVMREMLQIVSRRLIVISDVEKKIIIKAMMIANASSRPTLNSPRNKALVRCTTGVSGTTQLRVCTISGKAERGKNTPPKKNIGVTNRVKK